MKNDNANTPHTPAKAPVIFYEEGTCSLGSLITAVWTGKPFQTCRMTEGGNENSDFLELNALGEVPLLFENGTVITENMAVLHHLAARDGSTGIDFEAGTPEYDQLNRALGFLTSEFHKTFGAVFLPSLFHDDKRVQAEITKKVVSGVLNKVMHHAETHLFSSESEFMFDRPMITDAYFFAMARWADDLYDMEKEFPNISKFQRVMAKDPGVKFALEIEAGRLKEKDFYLGNLEFKTFVKEAAEKKRAKDQARIVPGLKGKSREGHTGIERQA